MNKMFSVYLKYIHNMDISLSEEQGDLASLRKYRFWEVSVSNGCQQVTLEAPLKILVARLGVGTTMETTPVE